MEIVKRGTKGREVVVSSYVEEGGVVKDGWHLLRKEERAVVAEMVRYAGDMKAVGEAVGRSEESVEGMIEVRPWVRRAIEYYMKDGGEALARVIVQQHVLDGLVETVPGTLRGDKTPAETKRKQLRDLMEAGGYFPRWGEQVQATQVNVKVEVPEWKR